MRKGWWDGTYCHNIEEANHDAQDTRGDEQTPERHAQGLLAGSLLVHVSEHVESDGHHGAAQSDKAMHWAQQRPVTGEEVAEERTFRNDEEQASNCCDNVTACVEEEELVFVSVRTRTASSSNKPWRQ